MNDRARRTLAFGLSVAEFRDHVLPYRNSEHSVTPSLLLSDVNRTLDWHQILWDFLCFAGKFEGVWTGKGSVRDETKK